MRPSVPDGDLGRDRRASRHREAPEARSPALRSDPGAEEDALAERNLPHEAPDPSRGEKGRVRAGRRPLPLRGRTRETVHGAPGARVPPPAPLRPRRWPLDREHLAGLQKPQWLPGRGRLRPGSHRSTSPFGDPCSGADAVCLAVTSVGSRRRIVPGHGRGAPAAAHKAPPSGVGYRPLAGQLLQANGYPAIRRPLGSQAGRALICSSPRLSWPSWDPQSRRIPHRASGAVWPAAGVVVRWATWRSNRPRPASGRTSPPRSDWPPPRPSSPSLRRSSPAPPSASLVKARHLRPAGRPLARARRAGPHPGDRPRPRRAALPGPARLAAPRPPPAAPRRLPRRARRCRTRTASSRRRPTRQPPVTRGEGEGGGRRSGVLPRRRGADLPQHAVAAGPGALGRRSRTRPTGVAASAAGHGERPLRPRPSPGGAGPRAARRPRAGRARSRSAW